MAELTSIYEIKTEMIKRYAKAYAYTHPLPRDEREFAGMLYEFDQQVNGGLEKMLDEALKIQRNIRYLTNEPIVVRKDALTVQEMQDAG